ncbi:hypothetical protein V2J94_45985, partial [Streptomyces sp. DSM 41524]|nr:hypothetical protein [Streptomyces sp. DSM 41524]
PTPPHHRPEGKAGKTMACNCGGTAAQWPPQPVVVYELTLPDGTVRRYVTHQEADAANKRAGSTGVISAVTQ